ncbi:MAG TPA: hypothetical protein PKM63_22145 [Panacibacter sp.]|nr:hypothetical protein [Panacibacter sp.]HNP47016.1 hypothetical protein [Panacibacter sp.]
MTQPFKLLPSIIAITIFHFAIAQNTSKPKAVMHSANSTDPIKPQQPVIKDTLAYNIQTTYARLAAMISDTTIPAAAFYKAPVTKQDFEVPQHPYRQPLNDATVTLPNSVETKVSGDYRHWAKGTATWYWTCTLLRLPIDTIRPAIFVSLKRRVDSIIQTLPPIDLRDARNSIEAVNAWENEITSSSSLQTFDELDLEIRFTKPITQTQEQYLDSMLAKYRPGFESASTAAGTMEYLADQFTSGDFPCDKALAALRNEVKTAADRPNNMLIVYEMTSEAKFPICLSGYLTKELSISQQNQLVDIYQEKNKPVKLTQPVIDPAQNNANQPQGEMVQCKVCDGTGLMDEVAYSHTYSGLSGTYTTIATKKVKCTFCNGTGRVLKADKKKK